MQPLNNAFQEYELTEQEIRDASVLNPTQRALYQNLRMGVVKQLLTLKGSRKEYDEYVEEQIHLQGQLAAFDKLLELSDTAIQELQLEAEAAKDLPYSSNLF